MKYSDAFYFDSDNLALFEGPVNQLTGAAITNTPPATSAKARLFHDSKDTYLVVSGAAPDVVLSVADASRFTPQGDRAVIWMNDNTWHDGGIVQSVDVEANTITIQNALVANTNRDHRVCVALGNAIGSATPWELDMVYYEPASGAVVGNFDYGWRASIPDTQAAFEIGIVCRIEMVLDAAANLKATRTIKRSIIGGV